MVPSDPGSQFQGRLLSLCSPIDSESVCTAFAPFENWIATGILHVFCLEPGSVHSPMYLPNLNQEYRTLPKTERNAPSLSLMFGGRMRSKGHYNVYPSQ